MWELFRNLRGENLPFWLGFLAGSLFWFVLGGLRLLWRGLRARLQIRVQARQTEAMHGDEIRLNNDTLVRAQGYHLAAALFSMDEIAIQPHLLAPPVAPTVQETSTFTDITDWAIPYMPDWPELASLYGAPSLTLAEILKEGCNPIITGQPGSGKSFALAFLATQVIQKDPQATQLAGWIPLLLHVGDLILPLAQGQDLLLPIFDAIAAFAETKTIKALPKFLPAAFENGRVLVLLDGLDELPPSQVDVYVQYLGQILEQYPGTRAAVSASTAYMDGLLALNFFPFALMTWNSNQRQTFIQRWSKTWTGFIAAADTNRQEYPEPLLLHGWLLGDIDALTPLELTFKVWAAFAGDSLGPSPQEAIEAYLRRLTVKQPERNRSALEQMALQMVRYMQPIAAGSDVEAWLGGSLSAPAVTSVAAEADKETIKEIGKLSSKERARAPGALPVLLEDGLILELTNDRMRLCHPVITGYLAGEALMRFKEGDQIFMQPDWPGKSLALGHLARRDGQLDFVEGIIKNESTDILLASLFSAARWLRNASPGSAWVPVLMRHLAECINKEHLPLSLRTKALTALLLTGNPSVPLLLRQMLDSPQNELRQLGALGSGFLRDAKAFQQLETLLGDRSPHIRNAAVLALVAIGDRLSLETVAEALLHGDEALRRAAAEALANQPEEGHPTLQEACSHEDPLVRRSAVFGLRRIQQPWSIEQLANMRAEDAQWVVQDAANQALAALEMPDPHVPSPLPELTQAPWLISFAADHGMGVAPGKAAFDLMYRTVKEGTEEQILAALYHLGFKGDEGAIPTLYQVYFTSKAEIRETTLGALWHLAASGVPLPPPIKFGLI